MLKNITNVIRKMCDANTRLVKRFDEWMHHHPVKSLCYIFGCICIAAYAEAIENEKKKGV